MTKICKPTQNFDFQKTELSLRFIWFEKFPWVFYSNSMGGWNLFSVFCLLLYLFITMEVLAQNIFAKNHIKQGRQQQKVIMVEEEHKKSEVLSYKFYMNTHSSLPSSSPTSFSQGNEVSKRL